jgi:hypothetical protein
MKMSLCLTVVASVLTGCSAPTGRERPPPTPNCQVHVELEVSVRTTGDHPDLNGYLVLAYPADLRVRLECGVEYDGPTHPSFAQADVNDDVTVRVPGDRWRVTLQDVAEHCVVADAELVEGRGGTPNVWERLVEPPPARRFHYGPVELDVSCP